VRVPTDTSTPRPDPRLWDFIPDGYETPDQFAAFEYWLRLGPILRTHTATARAFGISNATVSRWAADNFWGERALAYDAEQARDRIAQTDAALGAANARLGAARAEQIELMSAALTEQLRLLVKDTLTNQSRMRPHEIARLVAELEKLRRADLGLPDVTVKHDFSNAPIEKLRELETELAALELGAKG
jgi:hypothetical protein